MTPASADARLPTRQLIQPDVPEFDTHALDQRGIEALVELLMSMADDEFVIGFRDSEWTGIAPMLEEDVAFSSIAQDEIGHARVWYEMAARFGPQTADELAYKKRPELYRHARLLDEPRGDWAFTIARRWLYDTADAVRLAALADSSFAPLAQVVAKVRREERYHLMHLDIWLRRLADAPRTSRDRLVAALEQLAPQAASVFSPLPGEEILCSNGVLAAPMAELAEQWRAQANATLTSLDLPNIPNGAPPADGRDHSQPAESFVALWRDFTSVAFLEEGAEW